MEPFAECIINATAPLTPGEEGLKDMRVIPAIYEAAVGTYGRVVVR